jgi:hypothetical protein
MSESNDISASLSPTGVDRRERILADALRIARGRKRVRVIRNGVAAGAAVVAIASLLISRASTPPATPNLPSVAQVPPSLPPTITPKASDPTFELFDFAYIKTDDTAIARHAITLPTPARFIDDDNLLATLQQVGVDAGLVTMDHKMTLVLNTQLDSLPKSR